ncbi:MAG: HD domain-containing protein [Gammaproteobacteria bacterium]
MSIQNIRSQSIGRGESVVADVPSSEPFPRRSEYDVTNLVRVSSVDAVREAVEELFSLACPGASFDSLWMAFHDFRRLFRGQFDGYVGCDTLYHDQQHSLDVTLAMARLLAGYQQSCAVDDRLSVERTVMGLVCALFHDSGYIRRTGERNRNGAELTHCHIARGAEFLRGYLPHIGLGASVAAARQIVHFTGYEISFDDLELDDPRDSTIGHLLGTADMLAQMADRCYLEKCRDRLYGEFVLAGVAVELKGPRERLVRYASGNDLLRKTLGFWEESARARLEHSFNRAYRYIEPLYNGKNPYMTAIEHNLAYLRRLLDADRLDALRRRPPVFTVLPNPLESVGALVSRHLANLNAPASSLALN